MILRIVLYSFVIYAVVFIFFPRRFQFTWWNIHVLVKMAFANVTQFHPALDLTPSGSLFTIQSFLTSMRES